jgi:arylsulfatase A-like enzyme
VDVFSKIAAKRNLYLIALATICLIFLLKSQNKSNGQKSRKNIVLISLDTVRRDHCSVYGYFKDTTPFLNKMAQDGFIFLTEVFQQAGYETASFQGWNFKQNIFQGFDYQEAYKGEQQRLKYIYLVDQVFAKAQKWFDDNYLSWFSSESPFFVFIHLYDTNKAYFLKERYPFSEEEWVRYQEHYGLNNLTQENVKLFNLVDDKVNIGTPDKIYEVTTHLKHYKNHSTPKTLRGLIEAYDGTIRHIDAQLGKFMNYLNDNGLSNNTLFIITSDHGEGLGEHGYLLHNPYVFEEQRRIPLIFYNPGFIPKGSSEKQIENVDVMPTILSLMNLPHSLRFDGTSYSEVIQQKIKTSVNKEFLIIYTDPFILTQDPHFLAGFIQNNKKIIYNFRNPSSSLSFDLNNNTNEMKIEREPDVIEKRFTDIINKQKEAFASYLKEIKANVVTKSQKKKMDKHLKQLRSLGYAQ